MNQKLRKTKGEKKTSLIMLFFFMIVFVMSANAQQRTITGNVIEDDGFPLPGVTVFVKGTTLGTVTGSDGNFTLNNVNPNSTLVFSFVGMKTVEVLIGDQTNIDITMEIESLGLDEVVAIGYGTQKKANLTGAVSMATSERLENRPIASVGHGLQGVIPNLNIKYNTGSPTESADFNIRGFESINGGSPLILVDGVPMDLERLNPNDIASVTVLKDASAAAVYGARAAFGVILVETKKAKSGKVSVTLSTEQGLSKPIYLIDPITDPYEYVIAWNKATTRTNGNPRYNDDMVEGTKRWSENPTFENEWKQDNGVLRYYGYNDYHNKLITDFAPQQKYDMTVSGGTDNASYYVSFGFLNKDGYIRLSEKNENYKRYNILMKVDYKVTDWLTLEEKIVFNSQVSDKPHFYFWGANVNTSAMNTPVDPLQFPDLPYYVEPGDREKYEQYIGMYWNNNNFIPYLEQGGRENWTTNDTWFTQGVTLDPIKGLKIKGDFSYRSYWRDFHDVASKIEVVGRQSNLDLLYTPFIGNGWSGNDFIDTRFNRSQYYVLNTYAEYELQELENHYLKAMVGFNQEWGRNNYVRAQARTLITPTITDLNATTGAQETWGSKDHVSLRGLFYRLNYIYKDKYLIEANGRYDGTSRFSTDSRFGFFPSVSAGWRISGEPFMERTSGWLDNLKIRASYGELGNQLLGNNYYPYISTMGSGMSPYMMSSSGQIPYVSAAGLVSSGLTWETVATSNFGLDFTILDQGLDVVFDIYSRDTKDMLMDVTYPAILGTSAPQENAADLRTKGWELSVTWGDRIGQNWSYGLNFALSDNRAEITKYENRTGNFNDYYVGKKIGEIWGFETVGLFQNVEDIATAPNQSQIGANWRPGDIQYADLNNDGKITRGSQTLVDPGDLKIIGNSSPRYSFGINPDVSYKNWTLNLFFQGLFRDFWPQNSNWVVFYPFMSRHLEDYWISESWSEDNRDAYFPAPHIPISDKKNYQVQSRFLQNGAYVRLKNLTLNYNLPPEWINKISLSQAQIYFSGMNLWEYTKMHKPLDPEQRDNLTQDYYFQRIFTIGAKITF